MDGGTDSQRIVWTKTLEWRWQDSVRCQRTQCLERVVDVKSGGFGNLRLGSIFFRNATERNFEGPRMSVFGEVGLKSAGKRIGTVMMVAAFSLST